MRKFSLLSTCVLLSTALFLFSSCSDDDDSGKGETGKKMVPSKLVMEDWEISYEYDSQYRVIKETHKEGNETYLLTFEYDGEGRLQKEIKDSYTTTYTYNKDTVFVKEGEYSVDTLIINDKNQIVKSLNYGLTTFQYNADGTLASSESESSSSDGNYKSSTTNKYTYDKKKGAFADVNILSWQTFRILEDVMVGHISNITQEEWTYNKQNPDEETTDSGKYVISYSYNKDGYPTEGKAIAYDENGKIEEGSGSISIDYIEKK